MVRIYNNKAIHRLFCELRRSTKFFRKMRRKLKFSLLYVASFNHNLLNRHGHCGSDPRKPTYSRRWLILSLSRLSCVSAVNSAGETLRAQCMVSFNMLRSLIMHQPTHAAVVLFDAKEEKPSVMSSLNITNLIVLRCRMICVRK